jgi:hypothetical protein
MVSLFAGDSNSKSWSKSINGLQAKVTIKQARTVNETGIVSTYLTLRNVSDIGNPMKIKWDGAKIIFKIIDDKGVEIPKAVNYFDKRVKGFLFII